jgi:type IV pilus assembly protein PilY1
MQRIESTKSMNSKNLLIVSQEASRRLFTSFALAFVCISGNSPAFAAMSQVPMVIRQPEPPLVLLTVGRDEKLFNPAYTDYSDIDGDGTFDVVYKPGVITYYGLFDSLKCYNYSTANQRFVPASSVLDPIRKTCSGAWSGDFLNYITTSRADALRKVFYGGLRVPALDTATLTVLERQFIPQDAHAWGKEYNRVRDTYRISDYTPLAQPNADALQHMFANATRNGTTLPLMRVITNRQERIWNWVAKEGPVVDLNIDPGRDADGNAVGGGGIAPTDYVVRVEVCVTSPAFPREDNCKGYPTLNPTSWKPTGILHSYGENRSIAFGLLTGSYENARSGGVIRKNVGFFDNEINAANGTINTGVNGIVRSLDALRISQWTAGGYNCAGGCKDFGNPVAEMMYEGLRYFAKTTAPTAAYDYVGGVDATLGLPKPAWLDPYRGKAAGGFAACSRPIQMVVSDVNPTFDSDQLPGGSFGAIAASPTALTGLNVTSLGTSIWNTEGLGSSRYFVGHSLANVANQYDQAPTAKLANSFGTIRGIAPADPTRQGSYYAGSVAKFGAENAVFGQASSPQKVETYAIALTPSLPTLKIPTGAGDISIAPFGKSVGGCNYGEFVAGTTFLTNRIAGFFFNNVYNVPGFPADATKNGGRPTGQFRVSFEDNEQGTDNDMDAIVVYTFRVNVDRTLTVQLVSEYAAGCINQSLGFVVSGTTEDGAYLGVRDVDGAGNTFVLNDTANSFNPVPMPPNTGSSVIAPNTLGIRYSRTFAPNGAVVASGAIPHDPLWYAAKYGVVGVGASAGVWDANNDGVPDNYALVTDPAKLLQQISAALDKILVGSVNTPTTSTSGALVRVDDSVAFNTSYTYGRTSIPRVTGTPISANVWEGRIDALKVEANGALGDTKWSTTNGSFPAATTRKVIGNVLGSYIPLDAASIATDTNWVNALAPASLQAILSPSLVAALGPLTPAQLKSRTAETFLSYLKGDQSYEVGNTPATRPPGPLRPRLGLLGDIVNSTPAYQGKQDYGYGSDDGITGYGGYPGFVATKRGQGGLVWVGANDGMLHAFEDNATSAKLVWSFIPTAVRTNLSALAFPGYSHQYFVDGKVIVGDFYDGGWKTIVIAALGAGGRSLVAIDATNRSNPRVLWEKSADELGFVLGTPKIVRVPSSRSSATWAVVFGNGYESTVPIGGGNTKTVSKLFIVDAITGADLGGASGSNRLVVPDTVAYNGMGSPALIEDGNFIQTTTTTDRGPTGTKTDVWVGDLGGNLWKFDLRGGPSEWGLAYPLSKPLFVTSGAAQGGGVKPQPIMAEPSVSKSLSRGYYVSFGTGKFFEDTDRLNKDVQSMYLIRDTATSFQVRNGGSFSTDLRRTSLQSYSLAGGPTNFRRLVQSTVVPPGGAKGWYFDLVDGGATPSGERVLGSSIIYLPDVFVGTFSPNEDVCSEGSNGWFMGVPIEGGNREGLFDTNGDGLFNSSDTRVAGVKTSGGGIQGDIGMIATADGQSLAFVGVPGVSPSQAGLANAPKSPVAKRKTYAGRFSWRKIQ